jgi:ferritin-like metal-binding protein YciE
MASTKKNSGKAAKLSPTGSELLVLELREIHSAESQLSKVLPKVAKAIESQGLRDMADERLTEGERIISEVEAALEEMEETPGRKKNIAAEGLIADAREHTQEIEQGVALDAVLVASLQKTEHYCIAAWGTAKSLAAATGQKTVVKAMERALKEGGKFDERLTKLAEEELTPALLEMEQSDEGDEEVGEPPRGRSGGRNGSEART